MRKQLWITAALTAAAALSVSVSAFAGQWKQDGNGWWWDRGDGTWPSSMWEWIDGDENGVEECYCFDAAGYMYAGTTTPDGYTVNADGAWVENGVVQTRTQAQPQAQTQTQSYFEKYGVNVPDGPVSCENDYLNFNKYYPQDYQRLAKALWRQTDCYTTPADTEGYQLVHLDITVETPVYYDAEQDISYSSVKFYDYVYDWYTGRKFPNRGTKYDDSQEQGMTLEINGTSYDVSYTESIQWESDDGWAYDDETGDGACGMRAYQSYVFKVPNGYDGLVFCAASAKGGTTEVDTETVSGQEKPVYAFDNEENKTQNKYFRINRQPLPERQ